MSIKVASNFDLGSGLPLDARTVKETIVERDATPVIQRYDGMSVYIPATKETWQLQGGITNDKWVLLGVNSSTVEIDVEIHKIFVPTDITRIVPTNYQFLHFGNFRVDGVLEVNGQVAVIGGGAITGEGTVNGSGVVL